VSASTILRGIFAVVVALHLTKPVNDFNIGFGVQITSAAGVRALVCKRGLSIAQGDRQQSMVPGSANRSMMPKGEPQTPASNVAPVAIFGAKAVGIDQRAARRLS
jgi:hypothetical protein